MKQKTNDEWKNLCYSKKLTYAEKLDKFKENFYAEGSPHYLGERVRFKVGNKILFAEIDRHTKNENTGKIDLGYLNQWDKAKLNLGADGDFILLIEDAYRSTNSKPQKNTDKKKNDAHKKTEFFEYHLKTVFIDKKAFDVVVNIRREASLKRYVYEVKLRKNNELSQLGPQNIIRRPKVQSTDLSESSFDSIPKTIKSVKQNFSVKQTDEITKFNMQTAKENRIYRQIFNLLDDAVYTGIRIKKIPDPKFIRQQAQEMLKEVGSTYSVNELTEELTVVYEYMSQQAGKNLYKTEDFFPNVLAIARRVVDQCTERDSSAYDDAKEIRDVIKGTPIYISPELKNEIISQFGSY